MGLEESLSTFKAFMKRNLCSGVPFLLYKIFDKHKRIDKHSKNVHNKNEILSRSSDIRGKEITMREVIK